ncbi:MAG: ATP-dependent DNA helicase RecG, partial [Helicobacter apodemus]|nr:ATP-dependent DNA helicase RecG [Helicobacter apodemus]
YQIIIVYPLVEEGKDADYVPLKEGEIFWKKHFQGVYVTYGKDKAKELVLEEFRDKGNILLATTLIEVGISLPKLSTIVIVGAERLGLATLHQLRGRVSRNGLKGYCFLYTNKDKIERLERFCQIQNGFEIAKLDLQYRNSGDLLNGEQQSGKQFLWISLSSDESIIKIAKESLGG